MTLKRAATLAAIALGAELALIGIYVFGPDVEQRAQARNRERAAAL